MKWRLLAAAASAALALASGSVQAQETWRIGALYPLSGNLALLGNDNLVGARIAVEIINERGGVTGKKVELVTGDATTPPARWSSAGAASTGRPAGSPMD